MNRGERMKKKGILNQGGDPNDLTEETAEEAMLNQSPPPPMRKRC
jgi:hypothetical protein